MQDLSIIIVTYNSEFDIRRCLNSILRTKGSLDVEILVVDNASSDHTLDILRAEYTGVIAISNSYNAGFSAANNQALRSCSGRLLMLLNPDTEVHEGALQTLVGHMETNPRCGCCGPSLLDRAGAVTPNLHMLDAIGLVFAAFKLKGLLKRRGPVILSGACLVLTRETYRDVGGLDERFFWCEDTDYCLRVRASGYDVQAVPDALVTHFYGQSSKSNQTLKMYALYSSMIRFAHKHLRGIDRIAALSWVCMEALARYAKCGIATAVFRDRPEEAAKAKGLRAVIGDFPTLLRRDTCGTSWRLS